jgi:hypothetical protein
MLIITGFVPAPHHQEMQIMTTPANVNEAAIALNASLECVANICPQVSAIAAISGGRVVGILAFSAEEDNSSCRSTETALEIAKVAEMLPVELQGVIRSELNLVNTRREIQEQIDATREAVRESLILAGREPEAA